MIDRQFAHYKITRHLGSGGMGDVYQASDMTLGRHVAIKFLPEAFLNDDERVSRFKREARLLAALNHPNIAALYGMEEAGGRAFLVMELVPGETLADRIARGAVPAAEALRIAAQIVEALEAAHEKGIIHRDLKPANIKLTPNGVVKVLDFGLAKVGERSGTDASNSPTQMTASSPGVVMGTPAYMPPEQAKGMETERAADIWAFGCVLYELLAGRRAFRGETTTEILAEVLKAEPDWAALPAETPQWMNRLLRRCLQKDVRSRFHDIADVRIALEDAAVGAPTNLVFPAKQVPRWRERAAWIAAVLGVAAATIVGLRPATAVPETHVDIVTPPEADQSSLAVSPDGRDVAFTALTEEGQLLWLRSLNSATARPLPGTEGASLPFWSPKGRSLGFFAESKLKRIDLDSGAVQTIADATLTPSGATWNEDGVILFSKSFRSGIDRVGEGGGPVEALISEGVAPRFLPDGRHFLLKFTNRSGVFVGSLDRSDPRLLTDAVNAFPGPPGHLLFLRDYRTRTLFVQRFDLEQMSLAGTPSTITQNVSGSTDGYSAAVSASRTGVLAYRTVLPDNGSAVRLAWFDRSGRELAKVGEVGGRNPSLSPDGRYIGVNRAVSSAHIWLVDTQRGTSSQLTRSPSGNLSPLFSPDSDTVVFSSSQTGKIALFKEPIEGGKEELLLESPDALVATDWVRLPQGDYLLYRRNSGGTNFNIWALPMRENSPAGDPIEVLATEAEEREAQFAPNGQWIAYEANNSGTPEIYIHPFPGPGRQIPVSVRGGVQARWNPDGKELFYVALDGWLMAVPVRFSPDRKTVEAGKPERLFRTRMGPILQGANRQQYVVADNGRRFLMSTVVDQAPITLILNWKGSAE